MNRLLLLLWVSLCGAAIMVVELSAVRLLAPWFGTSSAVWTNVIGTILFGLSLGYLLGSRCARGAAPQRTLFVCAAAAAGLTLLLPQWTEIAVAWFLPENLALQDSSELLAWGSLAATVVLFLPPVLLLGTVGPLSLEWWTRASEQHAGTLGGRLLAFSTLGSLAGTFATTHWLVPELGLSSTYTICAAALAVAALGFWCLGSATQPNEQASVKQTNPGVLMLMLGGMAALGWGLPKLLPALADSSQAGDNNRKVLASADSKYQRVRVVESEWNQETWRMLEVNEGFDSFQSVWRATPGCFGEGYYYDAFALPLWLGQDSAETQQSWRTLLVGLGAGSAVQVLNNAGPENLQLEFLGIEIDPLVLEWAQEFFGLDAQSERNAGQNRWLSDCDGRALLAAEDIGQFNYCILDAYAHQVEIPPHLATFEFFATLQEHLHDGAWLAVNVGAFGFEDPVLQAIAKTLAGALQQGVLALRIPQSRNFVLLARKNAEPPALPWRGETLSEETWSAALPPALAQLSAALELPNAHLWIEPGAEPAQFLMDDHCPMERLQRASLQAARSLRSAHLADNQGAGSTAGVEGSYDTVLQLVGEQRLQAAVQEGWRITDPHQRAQALVYANYTGRDYGAALLAALRDLPAPDYEAWRETPKPSDWLWVAERGLASAVFLQREAESEQLLDWWSQALPQLEIADPENVAAWETAIANHRAVRDQQQTSEQSIEQRLRVSRRTVFSALGMALLMLCALLFWPVSPS